MSGHSKWSKVKHQKEVTDKMRGKIFTKMANAIIIAVREGGGITDSNSNFKLRLAIEKAKSVNMPKENIARAIDRAGRSGEEETINEILYEAFGPYGVGLLIKTATANKQRTVSDIKNILEQSGGVLATSGAVSHLFNQIGLLEIVKNGKTYDEILELSIAAGAVDIEEKDNSFFIYTNPADLHKVREFLMERRLTVVGAELYFKPSSLVVLEQKVEIEKIERLIESLEELEDIQKVYANHSLSN